MEEQTSDSSSEQQCLGTKLTKMLQNVEPPEMYGLDMQCIYRVPAHIRETNPKTYTPRIVLIGPFQEASDAGKEGSIFESMEELKVNYLKAFLNRTHGQVPVGTFVDKLQKLADKIRSSYAVRISNDLILLENQLPFFVLEELYKLAGMNREFPSFLEISFNYWKDEEHVKRCPTESLKHFTDLLRSCIISSSKFNLIAQEDCKEITLVYSASRLWEADLKFKVSPNENECLLDLTYSNEGVLTMPIFNIHDGTEMIFRNMLAFEQCHLPYNTKIITQYLMLLDFLINTEKDVNILVDNKIIVNWMGDANAVATTVNSLTSNLMMPDFNSHYYSLCNSLNDFYESPRNK